MRFVNDETRDISRDQNIFNCARAQLFGRDKEQSCRPVGDTLQCVCPFNRIKQPIDSNRLGNPNATQIVDLIFHQRLQRG